MDKVAEQLERFKEKCNSCPSAVPTNSATLNKVAEKTFVATLKGLGAAGNCYQESTGQYGNFLGSFLSLYSCTGKTMYTTVATCQNLTSSDREMQSDLVERIFPSVAPGGEEPDIGKALENTLRWAKDLADYYSRKFRRRKKKSQRGDVYRELAAFKGNLKKLESQLDTMTQASCEFTMGLQAKGEKPASKAKPSPETLRKLGGVL